MSPLAVSLGDPAGIGPELITQCWAQREDAGRACFFVTGGIDVLYAASEARPASSPCPIIAISAPEEATEAFARGLPVLVGEEEEGAFTPGAPDERGAALALSSLAQATRQTLLGAAGALVTAPVSKAQLTRIGFEHPGQTEFLAAACGMEAQAAVMMLAGPSVRTVPLTVHMALAQVPKALSEPLICAKARIVHTALQRDFGLAAPRLALAALNPHAGEEGRFGHEDAQIIAPAIGTLLDEGIIASGPHPADALFTPRARKGYDAALCMYHDQALIPVKALDFEAGVNVTLGLPLIRTSPDHGTAFDIAGKGQADPGAMLAAIRMAGECAIQRAVYDGNRRHDGNGHGSNGRGSNG